MKYKTERRSIPTGVGRSCRQSVTSPKSGPSPRAWGGCGAAPCFNPGERSIPTGVGRFSVLPTRSATWTVHPHGRGAVSLPALVQLRSIPTGVGSFPRPSLSPPSSLRSIPPGVGRLGEPLDAKLRDGPSPRAWGGYPNRRRADVIPVHPHGCGDVGSRGCSRRVPSVHPHGRGAVLRRVLDQSFRAVHPHGCGEVLKGSLLNGFKCGPSPRWGG